MTDNELLARWLYPEAGGVIAQAGKGFFTPDFRVSNEWAGVLLEKLGEQGIALNRNRVLQSWQVIGHMGDFYADLISSGLTWRDAVVEAALEIARREMADKGGGNE